MDSLDEINTLIKEIKKNLDDFQESQKEIIRELQNPLTFDQCKTFNNEDVIGNKNNEFVSDYDMCEEDLRIKSVILKNALLLSNSLEASFSQVSQLELLSNKYLIKMVHFN